LYIYWPLLYNKHKLPNVVKFIGSNFTQSFLTPKGLRPFFPKNTPNRPFLAQEALTIFLYFFCGFIVKYCPRLLQEHVQKVSQKLTVWIVRLLRLKWKEKFFSLCPIETAHFDRPWCKKFQLCNFEVLHHHNVHHVRYFCAKS
jgi:hypothetical protein